MRTKRLSIFWLSLAVTLLLTTCEKPERNNPWDDKANLDPQEWMPQSLTLSDVNITSQKLTWAYNGDDNIEGFKISRKKGSENRVDEYHVTDKDTREWTDEDIIPDSTLTYTYHLCTIAGENSSATVNASFVPKFEAPSNLQMTKVNDISYRLSWTDNSNGEQGFKVDRRVDNGEWKLSYGIVETNTATFLDTNVFATKSTIPVEYRVYAYHGLTETVKKQIDTNATLTAPTNLSITVNSQSSLTLNWDHDGTGQQGFKIDKKVEDGDWQENFALVEPDKKTFTDNTVNFDTDNGYTYRVYAYNFNYTSDVAENFIFKPTVTTENVSWVMATTAYCSGAVLEEGGSSVTSRGAVWSTLQSPTIESNEGFSSNGSGTGTFVSELTELEPSTIYYVRMYATNAAGTSYGEEERFITQSGTADVTTVAATSITATTAVCGGSGVSDGGSPVKAKGVIWSTSNNPTITSNLGITNEGAGTSTFTSTLTGLSANTTYYIRAYVTSDFGTFYGETLNFNTLNGVIELSTTDVTDITSTTAKSGGNISTDGGATITAKGVVWSTSENPTTTNNQGITSNGTGMATYTSNLTNLTPNTTYYVRAYATNSVGTFFGEQIQFTSLPELPSVEIQKMYNLTSISLSVDNEVVSDGGLLVTSRGTVISDDHLPTIDNNFIITMDGDGIGTFTSQIQGLSHSTTYYLRAYAINSLGIAYSNELTVNTPLVYGGDGVFDIDGNYYPTVILGSQEWMTENLKTKKYSNGLSISGSFQNASIGAYTTYSYDNVSGINSDTEMMNTYGILYNWYAVIDNNGLCPTGWHVPTASEWNILNNYLNGTTVAGGKMKSIRVNPDDHPRWETPNTGATNESGFNGYPGGKALAEGDFIYIGEYGYWWTLSEYSTNEANSYVLVYDSQNLGVALNQFKGNGLSVRCIKN